MAFHTPRRGESIEVLLVLVLALSRGRSVDRSSRACFHFRGLKPGHEGAEGFSWPKPPTGTVAWRRRRRHRAAKEIGLHSGRTIDPPLDPGFTPACCPGSKDPSTVDCFRVFSPTAALPARPLHFSTAHLDLPIFSPLQAYEQEQAQGPLTMARPLPPLYTHGCDIFLLVSWTPNVPALVR